MTARANRARAQLDRVRAGHAAEVRRRRYVLAIYKHGLRATQEAWEHAIRRGLIDPEDAERILERFAAANPEWLYVARGDAPVTPLAPFSIGDWQ
jgi:hypothetical protein